MTKFQRRVVCAVAISASALTCVSSAFAQGESWDTRSGYADGVEYRLIGSGVTMLHRELRDTGRGRDFVMRNFDANDDGRINRREAAEANRAFVDAARPERRSDWPSPDEVNVRPRDGAHWDRRAMRDYRFSQTSLGATMTLQEEVLFRTDSAELRPGALERLRPLSDYLQANPGVRVAIVGHTDSRGTDAHNQRLSEDRAASVRSAFDEMGVTRARFRVEGNGERNPVATNESQEGMRLNRRVEVTLLGERADRLDRDD